MCVQAGHCNNTTKFMGLSWSTSRLAWRKRPMLKMYNKFLRSHLHELNSDIHKGVCLVSCIIRKQTSLHCCFSTALPVGSFLAWDSEGSIAPNQLTIMVMLRTQFLWGFSKTSLNLLLVLMLAILFFFW